VPGYRKTFQDKPVRPGRELSETGRGVRTAELWRDVRCWGWDFMKDVSGGLDPVPAALRRYVAKMVREAVARESPMYGFARALELLAAKEGNPFKFGRMRMRLTACDNDTVEASKKWLLETGALSGETRPNVMGRKTDCWTMVRRPLFVENAAWLDPCMSLAERAMEIAEDGEGKHVLGQTFGQEEPDREKLRGPPRRFDMMTGEECLKKKGPPGSLRRAWRAFLAWTRRGKSQPSGEEGSRGGLAR
jgi:hypothetical protein